MAYVLDILASLEAAILMGHCGGGGGVRRWGDRGGKLWGSLLLLGVREAEARDV